MWPTKGVCFILVFTKGLTTQDKVHYSWPLGIIEEWLFILFWYIKPVIIYNKKLDLYIN